MKLPGRDYRVLDKDLGNITHLETAQIHALRPLLRLGAGILLLVAVLILALGMTGHSPALIGIGAALIVAGWLGMAIGANDIANSLGPAVGSGAIGLAAGLALVAAAEVAGAVLAGSPVTARLAEGIVDTAQSGAGGATIMLSALVAAAMWITIATGAGLPVSTSHSIVGAIAGAGIAALGLRAVAWDSLAVIATAWMLTPLASALLAGAILTFVQLNIREAPDREAAARHWVPLLVGTMVGLFLSYLWQLIWPQTPFWLSLLPGLAAAGLIVWAMRRRLRRLLAEGGIRPGMKRVFRPALLFAAVMMAFAHGAGDAGNVAGPLLVILRAGTGEGPATPNLFAVLAGAGGAIALGAVLFGRRLVVMVGSGITRLNAVRAFCITLATAVIVLGASAAGLPVSTTHVAVGGVFGVGFVREWLDRRKKLRRAMLPAAEVRRRILIRRSHVITISIAWLITVPLSALLGGLCCWLIMRMAGT